MFKIFRIRSSPKVFDPPKLCVLPPSKNLTYILPKIAKLRREFICQNWREFHEFGFCNHMEIRTHMHIELPVAMLQYETNNWLIAHICVKNTFARITFSSLVKIVAKTPNHCRWLVLFKKTYKPYIFFWQGVEQFCV